MERFQLDLSRSICEWRNKKLFRKHQTIIIRDIKSSLDVHVRHNLKHLKLTESNRTKLSTLIKALNYLPTLKIFDAEKVGFVDDLSKSINILRTVNIPLEQIVCMAEIIHIFSCATVKKLKLLSKNPIEDNRKFQIYDFLNRQNNLKI